MSMSLSELIRLAAFDPAKLLPADREAYERRVAVRLQNVRDLDADISQQIKGKLVGPELLEKTCSI